MFSSGRSNESGYNFVLIKLIFWLCSHSSFYKQFVRNRDDIGYVTDKIRENCKILHLYAVHMSNRTTDHCGHPACSSHKHRTIVRPKSVLRNGVRCYRCSRLGQNMRDTSTAVYDNAYVRRRVEQARIFIRKTSNTRNIIKSSWRSINKFGKQALDQRVSLIKNIKTRKNDSWKIMLKNYVGKWGVGAKLSAIYRIWAM